MHKQISPRINSVTTECKGRRKELSIIQFMSWEIFLSWIVFYRNAPEERERSFASTSQWKPESKPEEEINSFKRQEKDLTEFKWLQVGFTSLQSSSTLQARPEVHLADSHWQWQCLWQRRTLEPRSAAWVWLFFWLKHKLRLSAHSAIFSLSWVTRTEELVQLRGTSPTHVLLP